MTLKEQLDALAGQVVDLPGLKEGYQPYPLRVSPGGHYQADWVLFALEDVEKVEGRSIFLRPEFIENHGLIPGDSSPYRPRRNTRSLLDEFPDLIGYDQVELEEVDPEEWLRKPMPPEPWPDDIPEF